MATATITATLDDGSAHELRIGYELIGDSGGRDWVVTPGGRFSRDYPGVRELATALADLGNHVLIWDRPNTGESDVCFAGSSESAMQAAFLAALLQHLDMAPAVVVGGSGGARVSLLAAAHHREVASGLSMWWISGGIYGLINVAMSYGKPSVPTAWNGGMDAVVALPEWSEVLDKNRSNRERLLAMDPRDFIDVVERWMAAHCTWESELVPGFPDADARELDVPTLVFRSGASDPVHTRETSEQLAAALPNAELVEPPWPDTVWIDSEAGRRFVRWPELAPILHGWAGSTLA
jgi:pimeloyl-ACP methyl ester carboxylesterase